MSVADPSSSPRQPLSVPAAQTTHYTPGNVNVPTDAWKAWVALGETARQVGQNLQNSPLLNPVARAQAQQEIERQKLGTQYAKFVEAHPKWARAVTSLGPQGPSTTAPITQPVLQQTGEGLDWNEDGGGGGSGGGSKQPPTITRTGANTGQDENGKQYHENQPGSNKWTAGPPPPEPPTNLNTGMAQGGLVRGLGYYATGGSVTDRRDDSSASTAHEDLIARMAQERQAALDSLGVPPPEQAPPPQQAPTTPSPGMFAAKAPVAPPAAPNMLLTGSQPPPSTPGSAISQVTQQPGVALANWQETNIHPVVAPKQVLDAVRTNVTTQAQDATYLPNGGVNGEPAWAIHMKGGGQTMISASQLAASPWGKALMAGHNASEVMEAQQQQPQPGQQPTPMPSGTGVGAAQGSPIAPPAPTGQGPTPMPSGTGVGAPQGPPAAPSPQDYNAAAYGMPYGRTITATGEVNPALMAGGTDEQAKAAAGPDAEAKAAGTRVSGPDPEFEKRIFNWQTDADDPNHPYAPFKDSQRMFWQNRYYQGIGMLNGPFTAENQRKQQLLEEFGGPAGVPLPKDEKTGKSIPIDYDTIAGSDAAWQNKMLAYARDYKLHKDAPLPSSDDGINLANAANSVQDAQRVKDKLLYMKQNNIPMDVISHDELIRSKEAGWSEAAKSPTEKAMWGWWGYGAPKNGFADELNADYQKLNEHLAGVKGGTYHDAKTPEPELWDWEAPIPFGGGQKMGVKLPKTTDVSNIAALNKIGSGDTYDQALAHIQEVLDKATSDYKNAADQVRAAGQRVPDIHQKNLYDLYNKGKGYMDDPTNKLWDSGHRKMSNPYGPIPRVQGMWNWETYGDGGRQSGQSGASPSPSPTPPKISNWDTKELDKLHIGVGDSFTGPDDQPYKRTK